MIITIDTDKGTIATNGEKKYTEPQKNCVEPQKTT